MDLHLTLKVMLDQVISQLNVDAADVILYNKGTRELEFAGGVRFRTTGFEQLQLDFTHDYAGRAISRANILTIPDISADKDICVRGKFMGLEGFVSYVGTPMISKGEPQGVLEIFHRTPFNLDYEGMEFIETLAGQAAMAINNATLFEGLQRSNREMAHTYDATIEGWVRTLDMRDQETEGHSQRVVNLTLKLARQAGIADERLVDVRRGALLHDIGKIGIPDSVLRKPGPLNDEEWVVMRTHPVLAYEMMSAVPFLRTSADIPYCHHEKWDGSGYPRKLAGEQIPFTARLFAVVDVWDALTSDRPYRKAWDDQKAMDYIKEQSGKHFDPYVIDLFLGLIGE
jgi:putative nucleotidyltransferase with HDIG domain